jgi:hypothetical protein
LILLGACTRQLATKAKLCFRCPHSAARNEGSAMDVAFVGQDLDRP